MLECVVRVIVWRGKAFLQKKDVHPTRSDASNVANPGYATKDAAKPFVVPFWHVGTTDKPAEANMELKKKVVDVFGENLNVPYMQSTKVIQKGAQLRYFRKVDASVPAAAMGAPKAKKARGA